MTSAPRPPIVAVTRCHRLPDYEAAIRAAGADVRVVDAGHDPTRAIADTDGLLLTGGDDVDPARYGEAPHASYVPAEPGRDAFEIAVVRRALEASRPVLAICRGLQVLNVACGGSLIQDISTEAGSLLRHRLLPATALAHDIAVDPSSRLAALLRTQLASGTLAVNSRHHQAVRRPGEGLQITATAADGIIEALERSGGGFCLGVQWHPENFVATGRFAPIFEGFVDACRRQRT